MESYNCLASLSNTKLSYEDAKKISRNLIQLFNLAIFDSKKRTADLLEDYYKQIYDTCLSEIEKMDINNYKIEIVFIPTNNKPIDIKKEIEKFYE